MTKVERLKKLLDQPGIVVAPGVYDCIGAKIAQKVGFDVVYMTGNGAVASHLGVPDMGLATMSQMVEWAGNIANCVDIPLMSDADNGYGGIQNVSYAVKQFEAAGVAAIHLEDQGFPKRCGAMKGVSVISAEEAADKIKVAVKTRKEMIIVARSDCMSVYHDTDEMVRRLNLFADAGADLVYPEMVESLDQLKEITRRVHAPVVYDLLESGAKEDLPTVKQLEDAGVKFVFNCLSTTFFSAANILRMMTEYKKTGDLRPFYDLEMGLHDYEKLMGIEEQFGVQDLLK